MPQDNGFNPEGTRGFHGKIIAWEQGIGARGWGVGKAQKIIRQSPPICTKKTD
jgi:hypothetical protein